MRANKLDPMPDYNAFMERITQLKTAKIPSKLYGCITKKSLMAIVDDILTNFSRQKRYKGLQPNQALRITKEQSGLARTFSVLRDPKGHYRCILETKSKTAQNKKRVIDQEVEGGFKTGKPAWRLDGKKGPQAYFSLVLPIKKRAKSLNVQDKKSKEKLEELKAEVALPWELAKESGLQRNTLGAVYLNKKGVMASIYSKQGVSLDEAEKKFPLTLAERHEVATSLLKTADLLHSNELVFQDFKPRNILLFRKSNGKLKVAVTDPGHVSRPNKKEISVATFGYESPEIALAHSKPSYYHDYFANKYKKHLSLGKRRANKLESKLIAQGKESEVGELRSEFLAAHPSNDMWALGVTLWKLFKGKKPGTIPKDKQFAGFFASRETRWTAKQALQEWTPKMQEWTPKKKRGP
ncbi:MAG: hypothetical protein AB7I18_09165 [Candidatus Berkiella sp.]